MQKSKDTLRILTLGASSTFGFGSSDSETYPFLLQEQLNSRCRGDKNFEVYNLAIPHANSTKIKNLYIHDAVKFDHDFVTVYTGANDISIVPVFSLQRYIVSASRFSLFFKSLDVFLSRRRSVEAGFIEDTAAQRSELVINNLEQIHRFTKQERVRLIVANQQLTSTVFEQKELADLPYQKEVEYFRSELKERDLLTQESYMLLHSQLMSSIQTWAERQKVLFVDVIGAVDKRRDVLKTWVHLTPLGNQIIASAIAEVIIKEVPDCLPVEGLFTDREGDR